MDHTSLAVITDRWDKARRYVVGHGYELRVKPVSSIVCHSTSNSTKNTSFESEVKFLYEAPLVSAHYLISKSGTIVRFLDPRAFVAWHAGNAQPDWSNAKSVGVELHHSVGDPPYPKAQLDALAALLRLLMTEFTIPVDKIETHGQIAIAGPYLRKTDPSDMSYQAFLQFRSALVSAPPLTKRYRVKHRYVTERKEDNGPPYVRELQPGEEVTVDAWYTNNRVHFADGSGFCDLADLEPLL